MDAENIREIMVHASGENYRHFRKTAGELRQSAARLAKEGMRRHAEIKRSSAVGFEEAAQTGLETLVDMRRALLSAAHDLSARFASIVPSEEARAKLAYYEARIDQVDDYLGGGR